jgi:hypothetical protein
MKFYGVITYAYVNEVIAQNNLPDYLCPLCLFMKVK